VRRPLLLAAGLAALVWGTAPAAARGGAEPVQVRALLTYRGSEGAYRAARLRIVRNGRVLLEARLRSLERPGARALRLRVRDLDADGEPEVVLDLYTGGAHCCVEALVYRYHPERRAYLGRRYGFGNAGYRMVDPDRDGRPELESADDRFAYAFTSYAASVLPLRIFRLERGQLVDVTRRFPALIRREADRLWHGYLRARRDRGNDLRGLLAAWAADMHLLGRGQEAWSRLEQAYRRGDLGPRPSLAGWPQGRAYLRALRALLRRAGYAG
jgi:hypothetical protein